MGEANRKQASKIAYFTVTIFAEEEADSNGAEMPRPALPTPKPDSKPIVKSVEDLNVLPDVDSDCCLQCFNAPLRYGINEYILTAQVCNTYTVPGTWRALRLPEHA